MSGHRYQIHFLSPNATISALAGDASANRRALEAAKSEARSHAARVSHSSKDSKPPARRTRIPKSWRGTYAAGGLATTTSSPNSDAQGAESSPEEEEEEGGEESSSGRIEIELENTDRLASTSALPFLKFRLKVRSSANRHQHPLSLQTTENGEEGDIEDAKRRTRAASVPVKLPKDIGKSSLDPFARSALELSVPDQHLLHLYLTTVPDQIYGSTTGVVSSIARHSTVGVVATNEIVVMWLLLVIESQIVSFQPTKKDRQLSILARRSLVYRLMNARLAEQESSLMDDYVLAVAIAGGCEHRMGNTKSAQYHVRAARKLLDLRGGIQSVRTITYPLGLMVANVFVENGVDGLWKTHSDLEKRMAGIWQWLRDVQIWNYNLRSDASKALRQGHRDYLESDSDSGVALDTSTAGYLSRRARAFAPKTALCDYVDLPAGDLDDAQSRFYLGTLFAINNALWAFRDSGRTTNTYLKGLTTAVEMSAPSNLALRAGGAKLPSLLLILMIAHNAVDVEGRSESADTVFHVEQVFEFVEMTMMASHRSRMDVLRAMSSWLTTGVANPSDLAFVNNAKLDIWAGEVEDRWLSDMSSSTT
ncbi:uncharacterized protein Z519_07488 [Cladophialophora bantiana CBS 173.52]|uniref:Transcription factor domain-containing protein n=1 Tax=Cladophialophora bantiana (strain ATCC 10958 / CBS 173.52 / CDC B-1940 / NIH 8579) TaxID=1442370 RepID=A0A0D2FYL6_CLAB1|nr:uncharacterized protein Z519_07488 [Cladophialophora bantiana CBS 173.52]KIW91522.1 hypothetical protein Z519_07488 [Cladophialophora bantiana CBS 173.52]